MSPWQERTFQGFHRPDGRVGTANYWLVIPLVFCENRNIQVLEEALVNDLGYARRKSYQPQTQELISLMQAGKSVEEILATDLHSAEPGHQQPRLFPNVDGIRFLQHEGGCGGIRQDAQTLCGLLAGYITHPNVAGATVLSLGCQNAQVSMLQDEIAKRSPGGLQKPLYILEQQKIGTEEALISTALRQTFAGLMVANQQTRQPAPLSKICLGLECGGSDGFSGISANPAVGHVSDLLVGLGGSVILAEFPELCGVEQELVDRSVDTETAERFSSLMKAYGDSAVAVGSGFDMNPSPGNIRDGLITDAMKSAGAARKGGSSPVVAVLDYPELVTKPGLTLLCTPGNDVESTTAEVGSGSHGGALHHRPGHAHRQPHCPGGQNQLQHGPGQPHARHHRREHRHRHRRGRNHRTGRRAHPRLRGARGQRRRSSRRPPRPNRLHPLETRGVAVRELSVAGCQLSVR